MKTCIRVLNAIAFACWVLLCVGAATGNMQVETIDYCLATGLLAFNSLSVIIRGF